jgi:hypothetical protein
MPPRQRPPTLSDKVAVRGPARPPRAEAGPCEAGGGRAVDSGGDRQKQTNLPFVGGTSVDPGREERIPPGYVRAGGSGGGGGGRARLMVRGSVIAM